jgi:CRP-like cAMP-binding protein
MREVEFIAALRALVESEVSGLDADGKAAMLVDAGRRLTSGSVPAGCRVVPFVPGRRPVDEASHPWLGSSDQAALILDDEPGRENKAYVLVDVTRGDAQRIELDVSLFFAGPNNEIESDPIPGWDRRPLRPTAFSARHACELREVEIAGSARLALAISPSRDLAPGRGWSWEQLDARVRAGATDGADPYTFGHLFAQQLRVELRLRDGEHAIGAAQGSLFVCDARRLGSLYDRLRERLIGPDVTRQAAAARIADPGHAFHPWYPVLLIGGDKAALYGRALVGDIVDKKRNLTDPGWLLRVGLYLEFLTFLGVVEAVRGEVGDLLSPAERDSFEHGDGFAAIRPRIDPARWREVWELRRIAFPRPGQPRTGPVSARNLLRKRAATLAFLKAHHEDLKGAIELAGPNHHNAQETWQRVFRDAERAVLRSTPAAFPELGFLPEQVRELVLWHRQGSLGVARVPGPLARVLGDQDGLFQSACTQYRESMNAVAAWSKQRALMDYTGSECVPRDVSLLETRVARPARLASLQRRDGYEERLDLPVDLPQADERSFEDIQALFADLPIFAMLTGEELQALTRTARALTLGPLERLIVQGQEGTSLFVVLEGAVEVILRREDGSDWPVDTMGRGALVGEMSLLTGEPRSATVRAIAGATVIEIGRHQYEPLLRARPALIDELAAMVEARQRHQARSLRSYDQARERTAIGDRIRRFVLDVRS